LDSASGPMATPYSLHIFEEVTSTQDVARSLAGAGPVLVVAHRQRRGRGRTGRTWDTAPRAVAASYAFEVPWPEDRRGVLPLVAGVAAGDVLDVDLKWPNDLMVDGRKVGGILVEVAGDLAVAGCGVNLWWPDPPDGRAGLYADDPGPEAAERFARAWAERFGELVRLGPESWPRDSYRRRCRTIGADVVWEPEGRGRAVDVAADGGLVVVTDAATVVLHSGEVRHVRPAGGARR